eukprot:gene33005-42422_t
MPSRSTSQVSPVAGVAELSLSLKTGEEPDIEGADSPRSEGEESVDSDLSDNNVFVIPSVFGEEGDRLRKWRSMSRHEADVVPKIQFNDLDLAASAPLTSNGSFSLSSSLIRDKESVEEVSSSLDSTRVNTLHIDPTYRGDYTARTGLWRDRDKLESARGGLISGRSLPAQSSFRSGGRVAPTSFNDLHFPALTLAGPDFYPNPMRRNRSGGTVGSEWEDGLMSPFDTSGNLFGKDSIQRSEEWANVFSLVASLLLARCLSFGPYLDPFVCPTSSS